MTDKAWEEECLKQDMSVTLTPLACTYNKMLAKEWYEVGQQSSSPLNIHDKDGVPLQLGDKVTADLYHAYKPYWKDLDHKKEIDARWGKEKKDIKKTEGTILFRDCAYLISFDFRNILIYNMHYSYQGEDNNTQCLGMFKESNENHNGYHETCFFNFKKG